MDLITKISKFKELNQEKANEYAQRFHIKADEIEYVQKSIPAKMDTLKEEERSIIKYVSTISLDRDKDIMLPDGAILDDFKKNPVVLFGHNYRGLPIGKDMWIKADETGLMAKQQYAKHQLADDVFNLHKDGFPLASSVGFIPVKALSRWDDNWEDASKEIQDKYKISNADMKNVRRIYSKWLLLEHSDVAVPSNPDALALALEDGSFVVKSPELLKELENEPTEAELKVAELEITVSEHEKTISELEHTITEKDAQIEDMEAKIKEKPKFTEKDALGMLSKSNDNILNHIDRKMGKV